MGDCALDNVAMERHNDRHIFGRLGYSVRACVGLFSTGASMTPQIKMILALVWVLVCFGAGVTTGYKWQELKYVQLQNQIYADNKRDMEAQEILFKKRIQETENNRDEYLKQLQVKTHENSDINNDLEHGRKWMRVLVLRQKSCAAGAAPSADGIKTEYAELDPDVRRNILNFRQALIEREALLDFCRAELISRSSL